MLPTATEPPTHDNVIAALNKEVDGLESPVPELSILMAVI